MNTENQVDNIKELVVTPKGNTIIDAHLCMKEVRNNATDNNTATLSAMFNFQGHKMSEKHINELRATCDEMAAILDAIKALAKENERQYIEAVKGVLRTLDDGSGARAVGDDEVERGARMIIDRIQGVSND